jgi:hypothetical protein
MSNWLDYNGMQEPPSSCFGGGDINNVEDLPQGAQELFHVNASRGQEERGYEPYVPAGQGEEQEPRRVSGRVPISTYIVTSVALLGAGLGVLGIVYRLGESRENRRCVQLLEQVAERFNPNKDITSEYTREVFDAAADIIRRERGQDAEN